MDEDESRRRDAESARAWRARNPNYQREWRERNIDKAREASREWARRNPEAARKWDKAHPEQRRAYYQANRERILARDRERYASDPEYAERVRAQARAYSATPEAKRRARMRRLAKQYGMTLDEYLARSEAQRGRCGSCGGEPNGLGLVVDHDHGGGHVRGLLCSKCNSALGLLDDSLAKARALVRYLRKDERGRED